jgi:hypothetical protein
MATPPTYTAEKIVRMEANERLDLVDAAALARNYETPISTILKLLAEPSTDGRVFFGCTVTNPVVAFSLSLDSAPAGLAVNADGQVIFKPAGEGATITLTGGATNYIYLYYAEADSDPNNRMFYASPITETTTSINTRTSRKWGVYVHAPNNGAPIRASLLATAVINSVTTPLVPIAACSVSVGGTVSFLTDFRRLYNVDKNINATEGDVFTTTDAEVSGPFTLFRNIAAAIKAMLGTANWRTFTGTGTLSEVYQARNGQANLTTRITAEATARLNTTNEVINARVGSVDLATRIALLDAQNVKLGNVTQTIGGVKTFSSQPSFPLVTWNQVALDSPWTGTNGFSSSAAGYYATPEYSKDACNVVRFRGYVTGVGAGNAHVCNLPAGFRPGGGLLYRGTQYFLLGSTTLGPDPLPRMFSIDSFGDLYGYPSSSGLGGRWDLSAIQFMAMG